MELNIFLRTLVRRWYVVLGILALCASATYFVADSVGPTYKSTGSTLVFPPSQGDGPAATGDAEGNPYLQLDGLAQARDIVIRTLTSKGTRDEFAEKFPGTSFEATPDFTNGAPIVLFTVEAGSSGDSVDALQALMDRVPETLESLQQGLGLPTSSLITSMPLTQDETPEVVRKSQLRAAILTAAVTIALGLLFMALVDALVFARRRSNDPEPAAAPVPPVDTVQSPDDVPQRETRPRQEGPGASAGKQTRRTPKQGKAAPKAGSGAPKQDAPRQRTGQGRS